MKYTLLALGFLACWGCGGQAFEFIDSNDGAAGEAGSGSPDTGGSANTGGVTDGGSLARGGSTDTSGTVSHTGGLTGSGVDSSRGGSAVDTSGKSTGGKGRGGTLSTGGASSSGNSGNLADLTCSELAERYSVVLARAQTCEPSKVDPCTAGVSSSLFCGCTTFASIQHAEQLTELALIQRAAATSSCHSAVLCPAIACIEPPSASCTAMATPGASGTNVAHACTVEPGGSKI